MRCSIGLLLGALLAAGDPARAETVSLARDLALSPNGATLAFAWAGDLWTVPIAGGAARRLTVNPAADANPAWSPDGSQIAFASDRHGSANLFIMSREGDSVRRVTNSDADETPTGWSRDGRFVYFHSRKPADSGRESRAYRVPVAGGPAARVMNCAASAARESPDGSKLVFSRGNSPLSRVGYRGSASHDVWIRDTATGRFMQLTNFDGTDAVAYWDGDGKGVYYLSDRASRLNVWYQPLDGAARAVTQLSGDAIRELAVSQDGTTLVYAQWDKVFAMPLPGGQPREVQIDAPDDSARRTSEPRTFAREADELEPSPDGKEVAFVVRGEIFVIKTEPDKPTRRVTQSAARDRHVTWSPDGKALYFVSDEHGQEDLYRALSAEQPAKPLSDSLRFKIERVTDDPLIERQPAVSPDGTRVAFMRNRGDVIVRELKSGAERLLVESWEQPRFRWSPDSKWIAYDRNDEEENSDIWIVPADASAPAVNISRHPDNDTNPQWSADGQLLAFSSRRTGFDSDLYLVFLSAELEQKSAADLDDYFEKAAEKAKKRKPLSECDASGTIHLGAAPASQPATTTATATATATATGPASASAMAPTSRASHKQPTASRPASGLDALRRKLRDWLMEDAEPAASRPTRASRPVAKKTDAKSEETKKDDAKKKDEPEPKYEYELDTAWRRLRAVTRLPENQSAFALSPDGASIAFISGHEGTPALFSVKWNGQDRKRLLASAPNAIQWSLDGARLFYLQGAAPGSCNASGSDPKTYAFAAKMTIDFAAEARQKWDDAARYLGLGFYHPTLKDLDWPALSARYRELALRTRSYDEFNDVFNTLLGELNASHLGISGPSIGGASEPIGHLGCEFDAAFAGPGLRIATVVKGSPADRAESRLYPGDILLKVAGADVGPDSAIEPTLVNAVGDQVIIELTPGPERLAAEAIAASRPATSTATSQTADSQPATSSASASASASAPAGPREIVIRPIGNAALQSLYYDAWVDANRKFVDEKSGGRVGYAHISGMGEPQFNTFERDLYAAAHGKDGLIIDVRYNGGGWTADWIMTVLNVQRHAYTVSRGGKPGYPQDRLVFYAWTKPATMMCNQFSFSNAEIVSHAFKTLKRGPLVGMTTFGGVISTGSYGLVDGAAIRMPNRGWYLIGDGADMENNGAVPDVLVTQTPEDEEAGAFGQLEAAVKATLEQLK